MAEQVTIMAIKVDLQCDRCYKKIQKILCEIPQVRDRIFYKEQNTVTISVECCCPEKVRQKICRKGGEIIVGIDIVPPKPDKVVQKQKPSTKDKSVQTQEPDTTVQSPQTPPKRRPPQPVPPPPVTGYPVAYVMGGLHVSPSCHNRGCGWFRPCNCHCGRSSWPTCHDRCGWPPMCGGGCGRPAHECGCWRPSYPRCCDRCYDGSASSLWMLHGCNH